MLLRNFNFNCNLAETFMACSIYSFLLSFVGFPQPIVICDVSVRSAIVGLLYCLRTCKLLECFRNFLDFRTNCSVTSRGLLLLTFMLEFNIDFYPYQFKGPVFDSSLRLKIGRKLDCAREKLLSCQSYMVKRGFVFLVWVRLVLA